MKRVILAVLIVFLVVIGAMAILITFNKDKIVSKGLNKMFTEVETQITPNLPADIDKEQVHLVFEKAIAKVQSGDFQPEKIQGIIMIYRECAKDKQIDSDEAKKILKQVEKYLE